MFKPYGKKQRCLWCGKSGKESYKEITMRVKYAKPPEEKTIVCSDICEHQVTKTTEFIEKGAAFYLIGTILGLTFSLLGAFISPILTGNGVILLGITLFIFPFVTPQTVKILGLKNGMICGRIMGIIILITGIMLMFG